MDKLITQAETSIKNHQLRLNKQRRSRIDLLVHQPDHYLDITMVDRLMRDMYPGISHNTIYRNLEEFEEIGLVEITQRSNCKAVKFSCEDGAHQHHHHFICQKCGRVQEIQMPKWPTNFYEQQLPGVQITGHSFELYGLCAQCAKEAGSK